MTLGRALLLSLIFHAGTSSAEIIEIKNNIPYRQTFNLREATTFKIETSNGEIQLLPAEDELFTIEASASGFHPHHKP